MKYIHVESLLRLKKSDTESFRQIIEIYGECSMSFTRGFECHRRFSKGQDGVEDDECFGHPQVKRPDRNSQ